MTSYMGVVLQEMRSRKVVVVVTMMMMMVMVMIVMFLFQVLSCVRMS